VNTTPQISGWLVRAATAAFVLVVAPIVLAQEDPEDLADANAPGRGARSRGLDEPGFLRGLLGGPSSIDRAKVILEFRLQKILEEAHREYSLTTDQKTKLELAGRGDIKHFLDRVNETRNKFLVVQSDRNEVFMLLRESKSFQQALAAGLFHDGSLYSKTFARAITREQSARAAKLRLARELARHRAAIVDTVAKLSRSLSLTTEQRQRFESVLAWQTKPPEKSGDSGIAYVMFQAARLPRSKLEPIFDQDQRRMLWKFLESYENIEEFLKDDGFIFDAPPRVREPRWKTSHRPWARNPRNRTVRDERLPLERMSTLHVRPDTFGSGTQSR
jgi:hypothetical protein